MPAEIACLVPEAQKVMPLENLVQDDSVEEPAQAKAEQDSPSKGRGWACVIHPAEQEAGSDVPADTTRAKLYTLRSVKAWRPPCPPYPL